MVNCLVSIIVPVYNAETFLAKTIESCLNQTYRNIELIIINDGSTDASEEIIKKYKDERIFYFKKTNEGPCIARNYGITNSKGHLIQFLDHDDVLDKDKLLHQVEAYYKHGDEYIYSSNMCTVSGEHLIAEKGFELYKRNFNPQQYYTVVLNQFSKYITTGAWLTPKNIIDLTYGWDTNSGLNDDGEYFMRLIIKSKGIIYCSRSIFYFRRDVVNSLSKQFENKEVYRKWLYSYQSYVSNFQQIFDEKIAKELGWKALSVYYCGSYPKYPDLRENCRSQMIDLGYKKVNPYGGLLFRQLALIIGTDKALKIFYIKGLIKYITKKKFL